jgi:hypothetical protein
MAKKPPKQDYGQLNLDPTAPTAPAGQPEAAPSEPQKKAVGVYLDNQDWEALDQIAKANGIKRGALLTIAVRFFLHKYKLGEVESGKTIKRY